MLNYWKSMKNYNKTYLIGLCVLLLQGLGLYLFGKYRPDFIRDIDDLILNVLVMFYIISIPFIMMHFSTKALRQEADYKQQIHDEEYLDVEITYYIVGYYTKKGEFKYFVSHNIKSIESLNVDGSFTEVNEIQSFKKEYLEESLK